jgi:hypothetical protein
VQLGWNLADAANRQRLSDALATLVATASANPQRVRVKAALQRARSGRRPRDRWTVSLRRRGDALPLQAAVDALLALFRRGEAIDAWGRYRLFADAAGCGLLLRDESSSGNPRDGYAGDVGLETVGSDVDVSASICGSALGPELALDETQRLGIRSDAAWPAQAAMRDAIVAALEPLGFVDATLATGQAGFGR